MEEAILWYEEENLYFLSIKVATLFIEKLQTRPRHRLKYESLNLIYGINDDIVQQCFFYQT